LCELSRVIAGKRVPIRESEENIAYTDGRGIYLPRDVWTVKHPAYKTLVMYALASHEAAHLRFDSWNLRNLVARSFNQSVGFNELFNIIEDARIENLAGKKYGGAERWMKFSNELCVSMRPLKNKSRTVRVGNKKTLVIPSLREVAAKKGVDFKRLAFIEEFAGKAILGRYREPPEPENKKLLDEISEPLKKFKNEEDIYKAREFAEQILSKINSVYDLKADLSDAMLASKDPFNLHTPKEMKMSGEGMASGRNPFNDISGIPRSMSLDETASSMLEGKELDTQDETQDIKEAITEALKEAGEKMNKAAEQLEEVSDSTEDEEIKGKAKEQADKIGKRALSLGQIEGVLEGENDLDEVKTQMEKAKELIEDIAKEMDDQASDLKAIVAKRKLKRATEEEIEKYNKVAEEMKSSLKQTLEEIEKEKEASEKVNPISLTEEDFEMLERDLEEIEEAIENTKMSEEEALGIINTLVGGNYDIKADPRFVGRLADALRKMKIGTRRPWKATTVGRFSVQEYLRQKGTGKSIERINPFLSRVRDRGGVSGVILIDSSGSMDSTTIRGVPLRIFANSVGKAFCTAIDEELHGKSGAILFSDNVYVLKDPATRVKKVEWDKFISGRTSMSAAIKTGEKILSDNRDMNFMVLITDGEPTDGKYTLAALKEAKDRGIYICPVILSDGSENELVKYLKELDLDYVKINMKKEAVENALPDKIIKWIDKTITKEGK